MNRLAISVNEFGQMVHSCRPPGGWGNSLAIAHSGGADSTCLLYLFHCWLSQQGGREGLPQTLLSLSINHSLQPGSSTTAENCRHFSENLGVPSQIFRIPWSYPPFPDRPETGSPIESVARSARYRLLFEAMKDNHATVIAMGHHADDHVETLLMRLARKQSTASPTGIRKCRRWGMGSTPGGLNWAGSSGMHHWIVRPLLGVPKDRILATCELHGLHYVDDPTNFQPSLTPRNFVRHCLSGQPIQRDLVVNSEGNASSANDVNQAIKQLDAIAIERSISTEDVPLTERLRAVASYLSDVQDHIDKEVTRYLGDFQMPSPPSTLLLYTHSIPAPEIQRAIVLRILRFISPKPWGTPGSEASRRSSSLRLISSRLWSATPALKQTFCAGSEVMWRPVTLRSDGSMRFDNGHLPREKHGWLASRQPPIKRAGVVAPCVQDISGINPHDREKEILWDNRFVLTLRTHMLPAEILHSCGSSGRIVVIPHGRWLLPSIVWLRTNQKDVVLGGINSNGRSASSQLVDPAWVRFRWIRSLEAI